MAAHRLRTSFDLIVIGAGPGRLHRGDPRGAVRPQGGVHRKRAAVGGHLPAHRMHPVQDVTRCVRTVYVRPAAGSGDRFEVYRHTNGYCALMRRKDKVVSQLTGGVAGLFKKHNITRIQGAREVHKCR